MPLSEFAQRRARLMANMKPNSMVILPSASMLYRNNDAEYDFRQNSDFYYLSAFTEPNALLVLIPGRDEGEFILFCEPKNKDAEIWHGRRAGLEGAIQMYGADQSHNISDQEDVLSQLMENKSCVYTPFGVNASFDMHVMDVLNRVRMKVRKGIEAPQELMDISPMIHEMRLIKSEEEIKVLRRAASISANAHRRAMTCCKPGMFEYQLESEYLYDFHRHGCRSSAYNSIVGGGDNACILHYSDNDQLLKDQDLVLVDAGGELDLYASDITRTFPVGGQFTEEQRLLYDVVLKSQLAAIDAVKPGNTFNCPHDAAVKVLVEGLVELNILDSDDIDGLIEKEAYKPFYMHKTSHWLGIDVHDVGQYKVQGQWRCLEPGMVLTIEPGLYFAIDNEEVAERWRGIGIRIEDEVLVTDQGCEVLTFEAPKDPDEIEALMASGKG